MIVRVLSARTFKAHCFTYPLRSFRSALADLGVEVHIHHRLSERLFDADVVCLTTEAFTKRRLNRNPPKKEAVAANARQRAGAVVWFDTSAGTGGTSFQVLPDVDLYAKNQLLADRTKYTRAWYAGRVFADYYHRRHGVGERLPIPFRRPAPWEQLYKLAVSWNIGLGDYTSFQASRRRFRVLAASKGYHDRACSPLTPRSLDVSCRMSIEFGLETVAYHRRTMTERLRSYGESTGRRFGQGVRLAYADYISEMRTSRVIPSPFGAGEVCFRDFECFMSGAALLKPDMSHLDSWPDYYQEGVTYCPHAWDFADFEAVLAVLLEQRDRRLEIAREGQRVFLESRSAMGGQRFAEHFRSLMAKARNHRRRPVGAPSDPITRRAGPLESRVPPRTGAS